MGDTTIEWTQRPGTRGRTWNPVRGCSRTIAKGAKQSGCGDGTGGGCYAERTAGRFCGPGQAYEGLVRITAKGARWTGEVRLVHDHLKDPLHWRDATTAFTNSMSDLFHESLEDYAIDSVVAVMMICALRARGPRNTFITLTKRARRLREYFTDPGTQERVARRAGALMEDGDSWFDAIAFRKEGLVHPSMWWGVSVENQAAADERIPDLLSTPAAVRFLSCEPLLGPVDLSHIGEFRGEPLSALKEIVGYVERPPLSWIIAGCESGPGARPCNVADLRSLRDQCAQAGVPFFLKQARETAETSRWPDGVVRLAIGLGVKSSHRKPGGVIGAPYLDGVQHVAFPEVAR